MFITAEEVWLILLSVNCCSGILSRIIRVGGGSLYQEPDNDTRLVLGVLLPETVGDANSMEHYNRLDMVLPAILVSGYYNIY